jgi:acetylornithine deacetylase/succinyl-diaminopimelate desuccinylase-like protein
VRHPDRATVRRLVEASFARAREVASARGLACSTREIFEQQPTPMAPDLVARVREAAERLGHRPVDIVAGAGHDAQILGRAYPTAMIFTVTTNGRSHCPDEHCAPEDCAAGVAVLAETIRSLAY